MEDNGAKTMNRRRKQRKAEKEREVKFLAVRRGEARAELQKDEDKR